MIFDSVLCGGGGPVGDMEYLTSRKTQLCVSDARVARLLYVIV